MCIRDSAGTGPAPNRPAVCRPRRWKYAQGCPCLLYTSYINLFSQKAFKYEGGKQVQVDLPDIGHRFEGLIQAMNEAIAETDEALR